MSSGSDVRGTDQPRTATPRGPLAVFRRFTFLRLGLAGQVFTFAAMVIPILLRQADQVYVLVFASAVSTMMCNFSLLAFPFLFPIVRGPRMARVATFWSLVAVGVVSLLITALTPLEPALDLPRLSFLSAAVLTATFGVYLLVVTRLIRAQDETGIGLARLWYGVAVLAGTVGASLVDWGPLTLTLATSLAYLVTGVALSLRREHWGPALSRPSAASRRRLRRVYLARTVRPAVASLAGGWTAFLPGLLLPGLGAAAQPWAVISRICGGFSTVLIQLIAPPLEGRLSRSIRERDHVGFSSARRTALLIGLVAAAIGVVSGLGLAVYSTDGASEWLAPLSLAAVLFWGPLLLGLPINRLPNFLGRDTARLYWDFGRAALLTVVFLLTDGALRLIVMGAVLTASLVVLVPMTRWVRAPRPAGVSAGATVPSGSAR
jgi:hypothetical protein